MDKTTIDGIDCYGNVKIGNSIELIFKHFDGSDLLDNDKFTTWEQVINFVQSNGDIAEVAEMVADND